MQYVVEDGLPHGITPQSVAAANDPDPARAWTPLTFRVTDEGLTSERAEDGSDLGADAVLALRDTDSPVFDEAGTRLDYGLHSRDGLLVAETPDGVPWAEIAAREAVERTLDTSDGPAAVVAAAHALGEGTDPGPVRSPALWLGLALCGAALTVLTLVGWARRRRRESAVERTFREGRFQLARVILDHEILEVSFLTVPEGHRPHGFTQAWERIREQALRSARAEEQLAPQVADPGQRGFDLVEEDVEDFTADVRDLAADAQALMQSSRVHGQQVGGGTVLDRVAQPLVSRVRSLQSRRHLAPERTVDRPAQDELQSALEHLLALVQEWTPDTGSEQNPHHAARVLRDWERAEDRLGRAVLAVAEQIERLPGAEPAGANTADRLPYELGVLREQLGLDPEPGGNLMVNLGRAAAAAQSHLGPARTWTARVRTILPRPRTVRWTHCARSSPGRWPPSPRCTRRCRAGSCSGATRTPDGRRACPGGGGSRPSRSGGPWRGSPL